ncbi:hypothetical protein [Derxia gummosa]|uniref:Uncharacterized protein n=1 Tax=Derxia gummosa DSM 723 TaxID=1121388 RepID=A0A8B6X309_9BURK|nr:hypothetical protein [Derxia gummosa]
MTTLPKLVTPAQFAAKKHRAKAEDRTRNLPRRIARAKACMKARREAKAEHDDLLGVLWWLTVIVLCLSLIGCAYGLIVTTTTQAEQLLALAASAHGGVR